ncbi:MAG: autotransporter-associated beta strand repeat-containing protein [bacterium]
MKTGTMMKRFVKACSGVAALMVSAVFFCGGVGNAMANGVPYYLDVNGTASGFGDPSGTINATDLKWSTDQTGQTTPAAFVANGQLTFGYPGTAGVSNQSFSVSVNTSFYGMDVKVPCTITLTALPTGVGSQTFTWTVVNGATLNVNHGNCNYNNTGVTLQGDGIINFNTSYLGYNVNASYPWTQNMSGGTVRLLSTFVSPIENQASYTLTAGTLNFANAASAGAFSGLGIGKNTDGGKTLSFNGGTVDNTSGSAMTLNIKSGTYVFGGNFIFAGSSSLNLNTNTVNLGTTTPTVTVSANTLTIGGSITNTAGLTKAGAGTLALTANNTYSGATTVNNGAMAVVTGGSCSNSAVTVAATSGNTAMLNISVTDTTKQWTCSSLAMNNAGTSSGLQFAFGATTPSTTIAPLKALGSVTFSTAPAITVSGTSLPLSSGNGYPLLTWGSGSPTTNGVALTLPLRVVGNLAVVGNTLYLQITGNTGPLSWTGGDGTWDVNNSFNATIWKDNTSATTYYQEGASMDSVLFDTTVGTGGTITLNTNVSPNSVTVNTSSNYTFSGSGGIAGTTGLTKSGVGTLTLGTKNAYSGSTTINAGKLLIAVGNSCSNSAVSVAATAGNTATLSVSVTNTAQQWACSALTVNNAGVGSVLDFNFGSLTPSTTVAPLKIAGAVTFTTLPAITVTVGSVSAGTTYPLMTWGSGSVAVPTSLIVNAPRGLVTHLTVSGTTLNLVVDVVNGTPYYLDVNGTTAGFGDLNGTTNQASTVWTTDVTGSGTPVTFPADAQFAFGYLGTAGINNNTNTINLDGNNWRGVSINVPCSVTLSGSGGTLNGAQTWYVVAGATLIESVVGAYGAINWNQHSVTFQGGGTIQFNTSPGFNAKDATITQNMQPSGTVNLMTAWTGGANYGPIQSSYTLQNGILNFATSASAGAFQGMRVGNLFTVNGGTLDNTSGAPITLVSSNNSCRIGGSFTFAGSSSMSLGTNSVNLGTVTPTITVNANTFTIGGAITNIAGLAKAGAGTLVLSGNNTYSGGTTVSSGMLLVEGGITGAVNVVGGLLGGTGSVGGTVTNQAIMTAAGTNSIGTLTTANLVMKENSICVWNYNATTNDVIQVSGSLTLPAVATVAVSRVTSGNLPVRGVLFTGFSSIVTNVGTLSGWVITGAAPRTYAEVQGNQVVLVTRPIGTLLRIF